MSKSNQTNSGESTSDGNIVGWLIGAVMLGVVLWKIPGRIWLYIAAAVFVIGGIIVFVCSMKSEDEAKRARGRGRRNDILTSYGEGSFSESVSANLGELRHGCASQILFYGAVFLILIGIALAIAGAEVGAGG